MYIYNAMHSNIDTEENFLLYQDTVYVDTSKNLSVNKRFIIGYSFTRYIYLRPKTSIFYLYILYLVFI